MKTNQARIQEIFAHAMDLEPSERGAYLDQSCRDDSGLRKEVESLIQAATQEAWFFDSPMIRTHFDLDSIAAQLGPVSSVSDVADMETKPGSQSFFFWCALVIGFAFLGFFVSAGLRAAHYGNHSRWFGWRAERTGTAWVIFAVEQDGPAGNKLALGDRLLALNGDDRVRTVSPDFFLPYVRTGAFYKLLIARASRQQEYSIPLLLRSDSRNLYRVLAYLTLAFAFYLMALFMGLGQPTQWITRLGFLAGLAVSMRLLSAALSPYQGLGSDLDFALTRILRLENPWHFALTYHFFYTFLSDVLHARIWRVLVAFFYFVCAVFSTVLVIFTLAALRGPDYLLAFVTHHPSFTNTYRTLFQSSLWNGLEVFFFAATSVTMFYGFRRLTDPDQRRRARWVVLGVIVGLLPFAAFSLATPILFVLKRGEAASGQTWSEIGAVANLFLIAIPVTLAYAVVQHRALGIHVVIRRSLQYLLARRVLQLCLFLPAVALVLPIILHPNQPLLQGLRRNPAYVNIVLLIVLTLALKYRHHVRLWLDRKFFHSEYQQERILYEVISKIKSVDTVREIADLVSGSIEAALHPSSLCILHRCSKTSRMVMAYTSGSLADLSQVLTRPGVIHQLRESAEPVELTPAKGTAGLLPVLAIPVKSTTHPFSALLVLGQKKAEEPYTRTDRTLLAAIADQMAVAYENIWLKQSIEDEQRIRREVLGRIETRGGWLLRECAQCGKCFDPVVTHCSEDGGELTFSIPVSRLIAERYRLEKRIGAGGMGAVYQATDIRLGRDVAVKLMTGRLFGDNAALLRFEREAKVIARLRHPGIITIHDFGRIERGGAFLVMELFAGRTWRAILQEQHCLPFLLLAGLFDQLLRALEAAHNQGVLHRDLKPENVLVAHENTAHPLIKVVDFGLAKVKQPSSQSSMTETGLIMGTAGYMSPEQLSGSRTDERTDIYSVGVMIVESVTGRMPSDVLHDATDTFFVGFNQAQALNDVVARCLAVRPDDRIRTADELRKQLIPLLRSAYFS